MMKTYIFLVAILPFSLDASEKQTISDRVEFNENGQRVVIRTSQWPDNKGGSLNIEQKLMVGNDGALHYDYATQTADTQLYHRQLCAIQGMDPAWDGDATVSGDGAGWHCSNVIEHESGNLPEEPRSSSTPPRSIDFVIANAPRGTEEAGRNFLSSGSIRYQSSMAGSMQGSVSVDGRCSTRYSQNYGNPFTGSHTAMVSCIVHEPRSVSTRMEGCVPKQCGSDNGDISVR
jgi:hypothetical protein